MTEKNRIIDALGERSLLLPSLIGSALAANDQAKYLFTLLQTARSYADRPGSGVPDLRDERIASSLDEDELDAVVHGSRREAGDLYRIPHGERIMGLLMQRIGAMVEPLAVAAPDRADGEFARRYQGFLLKDAQAGGDMLTGEAISRITSANRELGDSPHLLVMDLHKALNRLQESIATETLDGAKAYDVQAGDRALIRAFMRGVNATARLKFDHPGLATTATHSGDRLVLQNDIGTTDAHVLVVHVSGETVTVNYTDVHLQRLLFFESLFDRYDVRWDDTVSRRDKSMEDGVYHLSVGRYVAQNRARLEEYLEFLGSRLVFLIDWNRARKRLRSFMSKGPTMRLLKWAADEGYGHMAFLKLGGETLVFEALEFVVKGPHRFGERLDDMLGAGKATEFLRFVIKTCSEGLLRGQAATLIRDEVKAELLNYFRSAHEGMLDNAAEHAALIVEIASELRDLMLRLNLPPAVGMLEATARRAKDWEREADQLVIRTRDAHNGSDGDDFFSRLLEAADDVSDELEEAAFHVSLAQAETWGETVREPMLDLANLLVQGAQEYLKSLEAARYVHRGGLREDMQDFLESIHRIAEVERHADDAQRRVKRALVAGSLGNAEFHLCAGAVGCLETAADALMHSGLMLRDYVLERRLVQ